MQLNCIYYNKELRTSRRDRSERKKKEIQLFCLLQLWPLVFTLIEKDESEIQWTLSVCRCVLKNHVLVIIPTWFLLCSSTHSWNFRPWFAGFFCNMTNLILYGSSRSRWITAWTEKSVKIGNKSCTFAKSKSFHSILAKEKITFFFHFLGLHWVYLIFECGNDLTVI